MYCISCGADFTVGDHPFGCDHCRRRGTPASLSIRYADPFVLDQGRRGMARYPARLPYADGELPSLGEGDTPLVSLPRLAGELGLGQLLVKNEFQNPTGSHKDRMNPLIVARARQQGYETVAAASSGNEGVSLACYAAAAGLRCVIVATSGMDPLWQQAILATGAEIVLTETAPARWDYIKERVDRGEWFSATNLIDPPVGSACFGVQGYKVLAYELYEQMPEGLAQYILVPVGRGDLLWGLYEGFAELREAGLIGRLPALVAVEPFPRLERVTSAADCARHYPGAYGATPSIGGDTVTVQSLLALQRSGGFAASADQRLVPAAIRRMAGQGLYLEASSALPIACLEQLIGGGTVARGSRVVLVATSHGFKNVPDRAQA
ncbi:MAG: pyridoxal-phosphate dependent enzyme [Clostridiales bacterium]|nr:pyridoxal-phosphate dependent enzyme [Clostridiales bacterium]